MFVWTVIVCLCVFGRGLDEGFERGRAWEDYKSWAASAARTRILQHTPGLPIHMRTHTNTCMHEHTHTLICAHAPIHVCMNTHTHTRASTVSQGIYHVHVHGDVHVCIRVQVQINMCMCYCRAQDTADESDTSYSGLCVFILSVICA